MAVLLKNTLAVWLLNQFSYAREECLGYLTALSAIEEEDDDEDRKVKLNELDQTFPFSSTKNYFITRLVNYVNRRPAFAVFLVIGILYNVVFYTVKLIQAIIH